MYSRMRQAFVKIEFSQKGKCLVVSVKSEQSISESRTFNSHLLGQDSQYPSGCREHCDKFPFHRPGFGSQLFQSPACWLWRSQLLSLHPSLTLLLLPSHFSRVRLCVTPQMAAHQAPPSLGFSRQEHWVNSNIYASDLWTSFSSSDSSILWFFVPFETEWKHLLFSIGKYTESVTSLVPGTHRCSVTVLCKHGGKVRKLGQQQVEQQTLLTTLSTALPPGDSKSLNSGFFEEWEWYLFSLMKPLKASVQFSHSVVSDSLRPHESQHARPPCPSPSPGVHWDSRPSSQWCHPAISSSVVPFSSCPQSLPASESFPTKGLHNLFAIMDFLLVQKSAMLPSYIFLTFTSPSSLHAFICLFTKHGLPTTWDFFLMQEEFYAHISLNFQFWGNTWSMELKLSTAQLKVWPKDDTKCRWCK